MSTTDFTIDATDDLNVDVSLYGTEKFLRLNKAKWQDKEIDSITPYAILDWQFYIEMRSWGVKSVGAYATKLKLEITVDYYVGKYDDDKTESIDFDLTKDIKDFEINSNTDDCSGQYMVTSIEVDFDRKEIDVTFA